LIGRSGLQPSAETVLGYLEQANALCRRAEPWQGWMPGARPVLVSLGQGGCLLFGVDDPPAGFRAVDLGGSVDVLYRPGYVETRRLATGILAGGPQVAFLNGEPVPAVAFSPARDPLTTLGLLVRDVFRATVAIDLAASVDAGAGIGEDDELRELDAGMAEAGDDGDRGLARKAAFLRQCQLAFERYPETNVLNNVLGNLEGRLLYGYLNGSGFGDEVAEAASQPRPTAVARAFALVRRERQAEMGPATIVYERRMELYEGLPRFVELTVLRGMDSDEAPMAESFRRLFPGGLRETARRLVATRLGMLTQLNVRSWGASRRRFYHSGAAVALLLDDVVAGWRHEVSNDGRPLDAVLEGAVEFDGAQGDEGLLEAARRYYGYYERLEDEQQWERSVSDRRRELLAGVFSAEGTRVTIDVSALNEKTAWYDTATAERIGESVVVHVRPGVFTYGDGATFVECRGLTMVEDRRSRMFHITVPGTRLEITGDEESVGTARGAEFTEGLAVDLGGLRVRARRGVVLREGYTLFVRLLA